MGASGEGGGGGAGGGGGGAEGDSYLDARQRAIDEAAERRLNQIINDYQEEINNYETLQKGAFHTYNAWTLDAHIICTIYKNSH